jgi:hypothetical protein
MRRSYERSSSPSAANAAGVTSARPLLSSPRKHTAKKRSLAAFVPFAADRIPKPRPTNT